MSTIILPNIKLRQGMLVKEGSKEHTLGKYNGTCSKGIHFGTGCYDFIGSTLVVVSDKREK